MARPPAIASESVELLDQDRAFKSFQAQSDRPELNVMTDHLASRGYVLLEKPEEAFCIKSKITATEGMRPPRGERAEAVKTVEFELVGMSTQKDDQDQGDQDQGAVVTSIVRAGDNVITYDFILEAPGGDFRRASEFAVEDGKLVVANSWWSAWGGCLRSRCANTCLSSLTQCSGSWSTYFWCVAARCGGCVLRCAACSTCDCRWYCRWATGCCDR